MMVPNYNNPKFEGTLNLILEDNDLFTSSVDKLGQIDQTNAQLSALHDEYRNELEIIHGQLATAIRRINRNLDVWLDRAGYVRVKFGDRARMLRIKVDAKTKSWTLGDSPFEKQFAKYNDQALHSDINTLAKAISGYFMANYKMMRSGK